MSDEKTSARIAALASQAMRAPETLTLDEIKALGASALSGPAIVMIGGGRRPPTRDP